MKLRAKLSTALATLAATALSAPAMAGTSGTSSDAFYTFYETVAGWTGGALGMGLATTMLLMGGAIGVAKNTPMPALTGVAGAAFLHWGPDIIRTIMVNGGLM
jgi:conjugal transfer pilus assembly protein TraA